MIWRWMLTQQLNQRLLQGIVRRMTPLAGIQFKRGTMRIDQRLQRLTVDSLHFHVPANSPDPEHLTASVSMSPRIDSYPMQFGKTAESANQLLARPHLDRAIEAGRG